MSNKYLAPLLTFWIFLAFATGIIVGYFLPQFFAFFVATAVSLLLVYIFYKRGNLNLSDILLLVFFFLVGAVWQISSPSRNVEPFLYKESTFRLKVISLPQSSQFRSSLFAQIKEINGASVQRKIKVFDYTKSLEYLDSYSLGAKLSKRKYHNRDVYSLWVKKDASFEKLPIGFVDSLRKRTTQYLLRVFKRNVDDGAYRFLAAVFLGRRELLGQEKDLFSNVGAAHLLAISGLHIGLTALILFFILRLFCVPFRMSLVMSVIFLYCYTVLAGSSSATMRAAIMYSVFAVSFLVKRRANSFNALGLAAIFILLIRPASISEAGFQLSFLSVFSILLGNKLYPFKSCNRAYLDYAKGILLVSLYVSLGISPLISYYFGKVYFLSFFYNVLLIPLFTIILAINFLLIIFSPISFIASSLGGILSLFISFFIKLISFLGSFPWSFSTFKFSGKMILGYYVLLVAILLILRSKPGLLTLKKRLAGEPNYPSR